MQRIYKSLTIVLLIGIFYQLKDININLRSYGSKIDYNLDKIERNNKCVN